MLRSKTAVLANSANADASYNNNTTTRNSNSPSRRWVHDQKTPIVLRGVQRQAAKAESVSEIWLTSCLSRNWRHIRAKLQIAESFYFFFFVFFLFVLAAGAQVCTRITAPCRRAAEQRLQLLPCDWKVVSTLNWLDFTLGGYIWQIIINLAL